MSTLTPPTPAATPTRNRLWTQIARFGLFNWIIALGSIAAGSVGAVSCLGRSEAPPIVETSIVNNAYYAAAASTAQATVQAINVARGAVYRALSGQPEPAVGLYWTSNADPTAGGGVCGAPLWQLLWRTDVPSVYFKSGAACTAWTRVGNGASPGTGTVTSITCGTGEACTPANPITTAGTVTLSINGGVTQTCGAGTAVTALTGVGLTTCTAVGSGTVGPGTPNRVAKFTAANTVGDTQFPIDDGATALTIGDNQATDVTTINGQLALTSTDGTNKAGSFTWSIVGGTDGLAALYGKLSGAGGTVTNSSSVRAETLGTADTTTRNLERRGITTSSGTTKSAGANTLTNVGLTTAATGGDVNIALRTTTGDVQLNNTSGVATIGFSNATASALTVKGQSSFTSTIATDNAINITHTPVAGTLTNIAPVSVTANGTFDTTAGALTERGVNVTISSTRSAGANNLTNIAGAFTASGAQTNIALQTTAGSNYLNASNGSTGIGVTSGSALSGILTVFSVGSATVSITNTASALAGNGTGISQTVGGTYDTTGSAFGARGIISTVNATRSAGANNLTNTAGLFTSSGAQVNVAVQSNDGANYLNTTSGNTGVGYASGATLTDKFNVTSAVSTASAAGVTWTPVAGTTTQIGALELISNGTIDTTAGALTARGMMVTNTTSRSAGANNLTNVAGAFTSTGAQVNVALRTIDGSNYLNDTSGNTGIGFAVGATLPAKLSVNGTSEFVGVQTIDSTLVGATASSAEIRGDVAASATVPTLIPNQAMLNYGLGAIDSTHLSMIAGGTEVLRCSTSGCSATVAGNSWAGTNASSYALINSAASSTAPTLIPNRSDTTTGIGAAASGSISLITAGINRFTVDNTGLSTFNNTMVATSVKNRGSLTLVGGSGTFAIVTGQICTCTDTTSVAAVRCTPSGTTVTVTGTGTDVIAYTCL